MCLLCDETRCLFMLTTCNFRSSAQWLQVADGVSSRQKSTWAAVVLLNPAMVHELAVLIQHDRYYTKILILFVFGGVTALLANGIGQVKSDQHPLRIKCLQHACGRWWEAYYVNIIIIIQTDKYHSSNKNYSLVTHSILLRLLFLFSFRSREYPVTNGIVSCSFTREMATTMSADCTHVIFWCRRWQIRIVRKTSHIHRSPLIRLSAPTPPKISSEKLDWIKQVSVFCSFFPPHPIQMKCVTIYYIALNRRAKCKSMKFNRFSVMRCRDHEILAIAVSVIHTIL